MEYHLVKKLNNIFTWKYLQYVFNASKEINLKTLCSANQILFLKCFFIDVYLCIFILTIGEGNGNPLQYSCLENPMDGGAW